MSSDPAVAARAFTLTDQREFARASGDFNPLHLDAQFARRTQMGAPVVHGIHTVLWALESALHVQSFDMRSIRVRFHQPLFLDEVVTVQVSHRAESAMDVDVVAAGTLIAAIKLSSRPGKTTGLVADAASSPQRFERPADLPFEQMRDQRGAIAAAAGDDEIRRLFPILSNAIGTRPISALMAASQVVGMACPGLHSLFAGLDVARDGASDGSHVLCYAVRRADARFRSLQIDIAGSRGLGEVTAKIIAAGGGHPIITYHEGRQEADSVATEIRQGGGTCDILQYDVLGQADEQLADVGRVDSCYYFATAKIFQRKSALFEPDKLTVFLDYYVDGFANLCTELTNRNSGTIAIFYPSTTALDAPVAGTAEYAMAKAAGETLVSHLHAFQPNLMVSRRLPRIATDQTATVGVASAQDALDVLLPIVHEVQQAVRRATQASQERP